MLIFSGEKRVTRGTGHKNQNVFFSWQLFRVLSCKRGILKTINYSSQNIIELAIYLADFVQPPYGVLLWSHIKHVLKDGLLTL
jgi:hypothetical protein